MEQVIKRLKKLRNYVECGKTYKGEILLPYEASGTEDSIMKAIKEQFSVFSRPLPFLNGSKLVVALWAIRR